MTWYATAMRSVVWPMLVCGMLCAVGCATGGDVSNTLPDGASFDDSESDASTDSSAAPSVQSDTTVAEVAIDTRAETARDSGANEVATDASSDGSAVDSFVADTSTMDANTADTSDTSTPDTAGPDAADVGACVPACTELRTCRVATCSWLDILDAVNAARAVARSCGGNAKPAVAPLAWNDKLAAASQRYVDSVAGANVAPGSLSGTAPDGSTTTTRMQAVGYTYGSVSQSYGVANEGTTPTALVDSMLASSFLCDVIMGNYVHFGFAAKKGATNLYVSWYFGKP